jgi:urea transporter
MGIDLKKLPAPVRAFFNGISQVVFIENVISGAMIFVSLWIANLECLNWNFASWDSWKLVVFVAIGVNLANLVAYLIGADHDAITSGLYGFCPTLICVGCVTFFAGAASAANADYELTEWIVMALGCTLCPMLQVVINRFTGHFGLPGFTFPFIVMMWFFVLIAFSTDLLNTGRAAGLNIDTTVAGAGNSWMTGFDLGSLNWDLGSGSSWLMIWLNGFEEIYVCDGVIASIILIAAYFWYNWQFALKACLACALSVGMALLFGANMGNVGWALYSYSAILTAGALDTFGKSKKNSGRYWFLWFFGVISTCLINYAIDGIFGTFGLPNCTFAFVLAGWIMLVVENFMIEQAEKKAAKKQA